MTADHSLDELEQYLEEHTDHRLELRSAADPTHREVRFRYDPDSRFSIKKLTAEGLSSSSPGDLAHSLYTELAETDIAFLPLNEYYRQNLSAAGIQPLREGDLWRHDVAFWQRLLEDKKLAFYTAGYPASGVECDNYNRIRGFSLKLLPIWPKQQDSRTLVFEPLWSESIHDGTLRGMSGGPAFAVLDGSVSWFGIQSSTYGPEGGYPKLVKIALATIVYRFIKFAYMPSQVSEEQNSSR